MPPNVGTAAAATATGVSSASNAARRAIARSTTLLRDMATPCYLPPTTIGHAPHLTPDNFAKEPELRAKVVDFADLCVLPSLCLLMY